MPRSVYTSNGSKNEQLFHEDLIVESLSFYGQNFYYIPRTLFAKDEILGEDRLSKFKSAYSIEMYLENVNGFDGQGAFIQKFGLMMEQSATLVVAKRRWEQLIGRFGQTIIPSRPCEGDLLYFPLTDALFEVKFVKYQDPFYQLGKLFVWKLEVELFQYASEHMETGVKEIDDFETLKSYDTAVVKNGVVTQVKVTNWGRDYTSAPTVVFGVDWTPGMDLIDGDEIDYQNRRYIVSGNGTAGSIPPTHTSGAYPNGTGALLYTGTRAVAVASLGDGDHNGQVMNIQVTSGGNGYTTAPKVTLVGGNGVLATAEAFIENIDNQYSYGDNNKFKEEAAYVVFNETNPFGDVISTSLPLVYYTMDSTKSTMDSTTITMDRQ